MEDFVKENAKNQPYEFYDEYLTDENREFFKKPIGLHDPFGENVNPFTMKPYELVHEGTKTLLNGPLIGKKINLSYKNLAYIWTNQPIYQSYLNKLIQTIRDNQVSLLISGTGTGKTLLTPRAVMEAFNYQKKAIITIPKKVITRSTAEFAAQCCGVRIGEEVGYYFKGDNKTSDKTKLFYTTTGSLISKVTGDDPYLKDYDCIIIDEAHERSVQTDLLLFYVKKALTVRKDLKLVIMSATISKDKFLGYFPNGNMKNNSVNNLSKAKFKTAEIDVGGEKLFTVTDFWLDRPVSQMEWKKHAVDRVVELLTTTTEGDILTFIASSSEGNMLCNDIHSKIKGRNDIHPFCIVLHGGSSKEEEDWAKGSIESHPNYNTAHPFTRKLVMATNVAESSITIDSIVYVVESGYHYEEAYFPEEAARSLMADRISQAAVRQRAGRAGRTRDGYCYHLYTEEEYKKFHEYPVPDIQKSDLTDFFLDMLKLEYIQNVGDIKTKILQFLIDPPEEKFVKSAIHNLYSLGCIDQQDESGKVTELGLALSQFRGIPLPFAKAILSSYYYQCKFEVMEIYSIYMALDGRIENLFDEPRKRKGINEYELNQMMREFEKKKKSYYSKYGDFMTALDVYRQYKHFLIGEKGEAPMLNEMGQPLRKSKEEVFQWFKEHAIDKRAFTAKMRSKKFDGIHEDIMKINRVLMDVVQPPELRKEHFNELKMNNPNASMRMVNKAIQQNKQNESNGIDMETNIMEEEMTDKEMEKMMKEMNMNMMQTGGYNAKPFEKNFFPNAVPFDEKADNITMSLCMGLITQFAKVKNSGKGIYRTCFPLKRIDCQFDRETSLISKVKPSLVMYGELFQMRKDQKLLKLNFVERISTVVMEKVKEVYPELISDFAKTNKNTNNYSDHGKKDHKRGRDQQQRGDRGSQFRRYSSRSRRR